MKFNLNSKKIKIFIIILLILIVLCLIPLPGISLRIPLLYNINRPIYYHGCSIINILAKEASPEFCIAIHSAEGKRCYNDGGIWAWHPYTSVDLCIYHRNMHFGDSPGFTMGCDCGPSKCYGASKCE